MASVPKLKVLSDQEQPVPRVAAAGPSSSAEHVSSVELFSKINELRDRKAHISEVAEFFQQVFGDLLQRKTGVRKFELCAGFLPNVFQGADLMLATMARFFFDLTLAVRKPARVDREQLLDQGATLIAWCLRRFAVLELLEYEGEERDYLLPLAVNEDATVCGAPGIEVVCAAKLVHRVGQSLHAMLFFRDEGRPLHRVSSWLEQRGHEFSGQSWRGEVCALLPLEATHHHEVIDQVRLGVPYAALQLEPGWHNLDTILKIVDERGEVIAEREEGRVLFVGATSHQREPISPQSRGIWECDPCSESKVEDISVYQSGTDKVSVSFSVVAGALTSQALAVRCIPRSSEGFDLLREETPRNKILCEVETSKPYQKLGTFYWHFLLSELELNKLESEIYFDIAVLGERGRVIVGALRRLEIDSFP